jgi:uncharacterized membrane protein YeaQ/YmgE (transglycosylase-associated protein family)
MFDLSTISKAIVGGVVGAVIAVCARYGLHPSAGAVSILSVVVTVLVGYVAGHVAVYLAPPNKPKGTL